MIRVPATTRLGVGASRLIADTTDVSLATLHWRSVAAAAAESVRAFSTALHSVPHYDTDTEHGLAHPTTAVSPCGAGVFEGVFAEVVRQWLCKNTPETTTTDHCTVVLCACVQRGRIDLVDEVRAHFLPPQQSQQQQAHGGKAVVAARACARASIHKTVENVAPRSALYLFFARCRRALEAARCSNAQQQKQKGIAPTAEQTAMAGHVEVEHLTTGVVRLIENAMECELRVFLRCVLRLPGFSVPPPPPTPPGCSSWVEFCCRTPKQSLRPWAQFWWMHGGEKTKYLQELLCVWLRVRCDRECARLGYRRLVPGLGGDEVVVEKEEEEEEKGPLCTCVHRRTSVFLREHVSDILERCTCLCTPPPPQHGGRPRTFALGVHELSCKAVSAQNMAVSQHLCDLEQMRGALWTGSANSSQCEATIPEMLRAACRARDLALVRMMLDVHLSHIAIDVPLAWSKYVEEPFKQSPEGRMHLQKMRANFPTLWRQP